MIEKQGDGVTKYPQEVVMKILIFSAHPDDAEAGCGGFCARASKAGHEVCIVHISKEVRGKKIKGIPESKVRVAEAKESARILGIKVDFLNYYMDEAQVTNESRRTIGELLKKKRPDIVLTQWPIDSHIDHQVVGILPLSSYMRVEGGFAGSPYKLHKNFCLGFYEVYTGIQTIDFQPNRYIDISDFIEQKRKSILAHKSQAPEEQVEMHEKINAFRGLEMGCSHAEAFHILGGQAKTTFDELFEDRRVYSVP